MLPLTPIRIRKATLTDYRPLVEVLWQADQLHSAHHPDMFQTPENSGPEIMRTRDYITGLLQDPNALVLLAEELNGSKASGKVVGAITTLIRDTPPIPLLVPRKYAVIEIIVVRQGWRGKGIGRDLMQAAEDWARSMGARDIELNVFLFNQRAIQFYESRGYMAISQRMSRKL